MGSTVCMVCFHVCNGKLLSLPYKFHSQWNLQSNFEDPLNTQKHGKLFHASWNLKLSPVLRLELRYFHPPQKYVSYCVEGHKKQQAQKQCQLRTMNDARSLQAIPCSIHVLQDQFTGQDLALITPNQLVQWMCVKVDGIPNPGPDDNPTEGRSSSLEEYKKSISSSMPHRLQPWN